MQLPHALTWPPTSCCQGDSEVPGFAHGAVNRPHQAQTPWQPSRAPSYLSHFYHTVHMPYRQNLAETY